MRVTKQYVSFGTGFDANDNEIEVPAVLWPRKPGKKQVAKAYEGIVDVDTIDLTITKLHEAA